MVEKGTQNGQEVKVERPIYSSYEVKNLDGKSITDFPHRRTSNNLLCKTINN